MLQDGSQPNLKSDILVLLVFLQACSVRVCEFHNHMEGVITEFYAVMLLFLRFIDNLTDFKSVFQQLKKCILHPIQKSQNTASENIRDIFKMLIFVLGDNLLRRACSDLDLRDIGRNLDVAT